MERCCSRGAVIAWASSVATPDTSRLLAPHRRHDRARAWRGWRIPPANVSFGLSPPRAGFFLAGSTLARGVPSLGKADRLIVGCGYGQGDYATPEAGRAGIAAGERPNEKGGRNRPEVASRRHQRRRTMRSPQKTTRPRDNGSSHANG